MEVLPEGERVGDLWLVHHEQPCAHDRWHNRKAIGEDHRGDEKFYISELAKGHTIEDNVGESRKEWLIEMMKQAGLDNNNNNDWQLWQQHNQPIELKNPEIFHQKLQYIHDNPVEAWFVEREEDYLYSSARDFNGRKGLIELSYIV